MSIAQGSVPSAAPRATESPEVFTISSWQRRLSSASPFVGRVREVSRGERFEARRYRRDFPRTAFHVVEVDAPAHVVAHDRDHLRQGDDEHLVAFQLVAGSCRVTTEKREVEVPIGDLMVFSSARPFTIEWRGDIVSAYMRFPPSMLGLPPRTVSALTGSWLARESPTGNIAADMIRSAAANLDAFDSTTGQLLTDNLIELLRTAFINEVADMPARRDMLRFAEVAAYIDEHIGDTELSIQSIARAHFVSVRTLHAVFRAQATSAGAWIRSRRLEFAGRTLRDPAMGARSISDVAAAYGFESASYFSVAFRAHFGVTPSQWRRAPSPRHAEEGGAPPAAARPPRIG